MQGVKQRCKIIIIKNINNAKISYGLLYNNFYDLSTILL